MMQHVPGMLEETKNSASAKWIVLAAAFLGWMFDGLEMGIFPQIAYPALNNLIHGANEHDIARWQQIIDACFLWGAASGGLVFGWLGDRIGRVKSMSLSILVYSAFTACLFFVQSPGQMAAMRFVAAIGMGGEWALGVALVMEVWDAKHRPILAGLIGAASNVGFTIVGLIGAMFPVSAGTWRYVALTGAAPAVLMLFIQLFVPESHQWKNARDEAPLRPISELFGDRHLRRMAVVAICLASVVLLGTWGAVQKIPAWVGKISPEMKRAKGYVQMATGIGAIIGCLIAPYLAAVLNRRTAYVLLCASSLVCCEVLFNGFTSYSLTFLLMAFLVGATTAAFYGWFPLYLPELFPTRVRATAQGIAYNFGRIFAGVGAIWGGTIGGTYARMGAIVSLIYLVGMGIIWLAPETKGKSVPI
jgi:MFS transporter, SHS family, sialic acid transporter